jgi:hypothetical protein
MGVKYVRHSPYQADNTAFDVSIAITAGDKLRFSFDHTNISYDDPDFPTYSYGIRSVTIENITASSTQVQTVAPTGGWFWLYLTDTNGMLWQPHVAFGFHHIKIYAMAGWHFLVGDLGWNLTSLTFSDCESTTMAAWLVARVPNPGPTDFEEGFDAINGTLVNLGASPVNADGDLIIWGRVASPAMVQALTIAWGTAG